MNLILLTQYLLDSTSSFFWRLIKTQNCSIELSNNRNLLNIFNHFTKITILCISFTEFGFSSRLEVCPPEKLFHLLNLCFQMLQELVVRIASFWSVIHQMINKIHPEKQSIFNILLKVLFFFSPWFTIISDHSNVDWIRFEIIQMLHKDTQSKWKVLDLNS